MTPGTDRSSAERIALYCILLGLLAGFGALSWLSPGTHGGQDDYVHYRIARYAFQYPKLFLDHWGKPIFTVLSSPFAQFGYYGMRAFNLLLGLGTAWCLYWLARERSLRTALLAPLFLFFSPIYLVMVISGMTEILFAFLVTAGLLLFFRNRPIWAAVVFSFLPIARTDGTIVLPWFVLGFLLQRQWKALPFLATGFLAFSVAGWLWHHHDFWWLIHHMPYGQADLYGSGELLHFVKRSPDIFGYPLMALALLGVVRLGLEARRGDPAGRRQAVLEVLMILMPFVTYFAAHTYIWWQGIISLGLTRVMACVVPFVVVLALRGADALLGRASGRRAKAALTVLVLIAVCWAPFRSYSLPVRYTQSQINVRRAVAWVQKRGLLDRFIVFYDPYVAFLLGGDPFDRKRMIERLPNREQPSKGIPQGAIVLWDAHFGPNEGGMPLERLRADPNFRQLKVLRPKHAFKVLNGYDYQIVVFERL